VPQRFTRPKPLGEYIADFYCASRLLIIEVDGDSHYTPSAAARDARRSAALGMRGLRILRFTNLEVMEQFEGACAQIQKALKP
jgi:very-short-patch-repair endonuclease